MKVRKLLLVRLRLRELWLRQGRSRQRPQRQTPPLLVLVARRSAPWAVVLLVSGRGLELGWRAEVDEHIVSLELPLPQQDQ